MTTEQRLSHLASAAIAVALLASGVVAAFRPSVLAAHFRPPGVVQPDVVLGAAVTVVQALALPFLLIGIVGLMTLYVTERRRQLLQWLVAGAATLAYISMQWAFSNWTVDDAAITFAYSENLVRGYGLVLHQGRPPEEAYSSTLWMLILALARWAGFQIDVAAKILGVALGAAAVFVTMRLCTKLQDKPNYVSLMAAAVVCLGAPFVIWTCSGLEHALQALLFVIIAALPMFSRRTEWPTAACLGALVLVRPETPLIVAATVGVYAFDRFSAGRSALVRLWPLVAVPLVVGAALLTFRLSYFGDPLPNPYYAKATTATFLRVFNIVGGGWGYVIDWLSSSGVYLIVPIVLLGFPRNASLTVRLACALIAAQLVFVLYAGGDWMGEFRFIAPILPLLAAVLAAALDELGARFPRHEFQLVTVVVLVFLSVGTASSLQTFRAAPTTPTSIVTAIGKQFVELAKRLGVEHPTLAHHDAGGTSWAADIDIIDLGGLGDRAIAKHMHDAAFMRHYLLVERRPTFVFGAATLFAAGFTQFYKMPEFKEQYVPLKFPGLPYMNADLCYIRRDVVHEAPGISLVKENGRTVAVVVHVKTTYQER